MIIDSKKYNGICSCGKEHKMTTEACFIEAGCLSRIDEYLQKYRLNGYSVAIYDENTYRVTESIHPKADKEIVLPPKDLHADNHGVALAMEQLPEHCDYLIAVGSGTIHDITRYCAYKKGIPFVSCPTAASVDGFCSSVAAMTWDGFKKTFEAVAPKIVIADLDVISKAPMFLTNSGFGDMIGKFIALVDWKIAHVLTDEYFCSVIHDMTLDATKAVVESAEEIKNGNVTAFEKLIYGLLMSGLAMQLLGNSRCASGAEHHISHLIEMQPEGLGVRSDALHGEKVGVGTLLACREYHRIRDNQKLCWKDYPQVSSDYIISMFGEKLSNSIIAENSNNCAADMTAKRIADKWNEICSIIDTVPTYEQLIKIYEMLGTKSCLTDIGIPENRLDALLEYSPLVRNRLTLMRLRRAIKSNHNKMDDSRIILAAHRGDKFNYPENTMQAFKSAIDLGVDMIETDVRMTKDGELVLIHDRSAFRTTGVVKNIDEMTLTEVKALDAGCMTEKPMKADIPTVREFLELVKDTDVLVNWEFKVYPLDFGAEIAFEVVDKLVALLEEYNMTNRSMMNSFSAKILEYIFNKHGNKFPIHGQGIYQCSRSKDHPDIKESDLFDWCCLYPNSPGSKAIEFKENFDYCAEHNIFPCLCIPDTMEDYKTAVAYGCKMFTSNNVYEASRILRELGVR